MKSIQETKMFYKEIIEDFKNKIGLKIEEVMLLEAISFKLSNIEEMNTNNFSIYNSKYVFNYLDTNVLNIFMDETKSYKVNPVLYYGEKVIKQSNIYKLIIKNKIKKYTLNSIEDIASHIIREITLDVYKEEYFNKKIVTDYYCTSTENYDDFTFSKNTLSDNEKEEVIKYIMDNLAKEDISKLESFFINRFSKEYDKLRVLIIDYLNYTSLFYEPFSDAESIKEYFNKVTLNDALLLLFISLYIEKNGDSEEFEDIFKREILVNSDFKNSFFRSLELLLTYGKGAYDDILGMA